MTSTDAAGTHRARPRVAVIVPAYNSAAYIFQTIQSIVEQTRIPDEIIVIDDGSTDDTGAIAAKAHHSVKVFRQNNGGQGSARQHGFTVANADQLLFLDADDILKPTALEKLSAALSAASGAALAYCPAELWSPAKPDQPTSEIFSAKPCREDLWASLLRYNFICTPGCALVSAAALRETGGWDPDVRLKGNEDWELWLRLAEKHSFVFVPEPLVKYRLHSTGFSRSRSRMYKSLRVMFAKHKQRWQDSRSRRAEIAEGEWFNCRHIMGQIKHECRVAASQFKVAAAARGFYDLICIGARPALARAFHLPF